MKQTRTPVNANAFIVTLATPDSCMDGRNSFRLAQKKRILRQPK